MSTYICIPNEETDDYLTDVETYTTDTPAEIEIAQEAMRASGITEADVWAGDPECPDSYKNGQKLFA